MTQAIFRGFLSGTREFRQNSLDSRRIHKHRGVRTLDRMITKLQDALMEGDAQLVKQLTETAISQGVSPKIIIQKGLINGMTTIGQKFRGNEVFIPDVLMASRAMHAGLYILRPLLANSRIATKGRVVLGTVAGDLHDIGKNMVCMMLQGAGYEVFDIGIDVPAAEFERAVKEYRPDILAMSALLSTTIEELGDVITHLEQEGLRNSVTIIVGGGPVTPDFARAVGADAYASDAYRAVTVANRLMKREIGFFSEI